MMAAFTWIITFVSLAGTVLNVRKNILCFYLWAIGNIACKGLIQRRSLVVSVG